MLRYGDGNKLEAEGVLSLQGERPIRGLKGRITGLVLDPSLIEDHDDFASGTENPPRAGLPAEVPGFGVVLNQIEKSQERRNGVIGAKAQDPGNKVSLGKPGIRGVPGNLRLKIRRGLELDRTLQL